VLHRKDDIWISASFKEKTTFMIFWKQRRLCQYLVVFKNSNEVKNSLNESRQSSSIQMGKWRATDKKQNVSFHVRQADSSQLLNQPLFLSVDEHFRIRIEKESLHSLILAFLGLPFNLAPRNVKNKIKTGCSQILWFYKRSAVFSMVQIITVVAGSIRIRHSLGSGYFSAKIINFLQVIGSQQNPSFHDATVWPWQKIDLFSDELFYVKKSYPVHFSQLQYPWVVGESLIAQRDLAGRLSAEF